MIPETRTLAKLRFLVLWARIKEAHRKRLAETVAKRNRDRHLSRAHTPTKTNQ